VKRRRSPYGKVTAAERSKLWRKEFPDRAKVTDRNARLKRVFGITENQFEELLVKQNYCCAVCLVHQDEHKTRFHIDHNHKTGEIRGLLCNFCNRRVIGRHTDADKFERAAAYLRQGTGWVVPPKRKKKRCRKRRKRLTKSTV
jgi:hypothetical protein